MTHVQVTKVQRRQFQFGIVLILLAIFSVLQGAYFHVEDSAQRDCLAKVVRQMRASIETRVAIADRDSRNKTITIRRVATANAENKPREVMRALDDFVMEDDKINVMRENNPVPPLPEGRCD